MKINKDVPATSFTSGDIVRIRFHNSGNTYLVLVKEDASYGIALEVERGVGATIGDTITLGDCSILNIYKSAVLTLGPSS